MSFTAPFIDGISGADDLCELHALSASLPNASQYRAVLSDSTTHARERFTVTGEIRLVNGDTVATSSASLWSSGSVMTRVNRTESGEAAVALVHTGTAPNGARHGSAMASNFCGDWSANSGVGEIGFTDATNGQWIALNFPVLPGPQCSSTHRIYCMGPG